LSKLFKGSVITFVTLALTFLLRFGTRVLIGRTLGPSGKGVYALVVLTASWLVLFCGLGLDVSYAFFSASKKYSLRQLGSHSLLAGVVLGLGGGIVSLPILTALTGNLLKGVEYEHLLMVVFSLPFGLLFAYWIKLILGLERLATYNLINFSRFAILLVLVALGLLVFKGGVYVAVLAWVLSTVTAAFLCLLVLKKQAGFSIEFDRDLTKESLVFGLKSYIANLTATFSYRADMYLVNVFLDVTSVGWYSVSVSIAELIWYVPNAVSTALFPRVSTIGPERANQVTPVVARNLFLVILVIGLGVSVLAPFMIDLLFPRGDFAPAVPALWLLMPGVIANGSAKVIFADLTGRGKPIYATYNSSIGMAVTLVADVLLIPSLGINGAALASSIGYSVAAVTALFWFNKETGVRWFEMLVPSRQDLTFYKILLSGVRDMKQ
jgi:O-antigen/teichoic acid export membrane protein